MWNSIVGKEEKKELDYDLLTFRNVDLFIIHVDNCKTRETR